LTRYQEAIEAIKSNYPTAGYSMLREALDLALELLTKEVQKDARANWTEEQWEKHLDDIRFENEYC